GGYVELQGVPDLVVEVVSPSSVTKDNDVLPKAYWESGIPEYWIVDARQEPLHFAILCWTSAGYVTVRRFKGWHKSHVLGVEGRLLEESQQDGRPDYTFEIR